MELINQSSVQLTRCFVVDVYKQNYATMEYKNPRPAMAAEKYRHAGTFGYCKLHEAIRETKTLTPVRGNKKLTLE